MKRLLMTLTLIFILCLSAFTLTACQGPHVHTFDNYVCECGVEDYTEGLQFIKTAEEDGYILYGLGNAEDSSLVIPSTYKNLPVIEIGEEAFRNNKYINNIIILGNVRKIGNHAFSNCDSLESIEIPDSVTSIGMGAFSNCDSLESIQIPASVTSIGEGAFCLCYSLKLISCEIESQPEDYYNLNGEGTSASIAWGKTIVNLTQIEGLTYALFSDATAMLINAPQNVTNVIVKSEIIYNEETYLITSIGEESFDGCDFLQSIVISDNVTSIGGGAFYGCYRLVEVINKSEHITVTKGSSDNGDLGYYALSVSNREDNYVSKLSTDANGFVIYTEGEEKILVNYIGSETDITIPNGITKINNYAFYYCDSLTSIEIPVSVTSIGDWAFDNCDNLTSVTFGENSQLTSIGERAFNYCFSLESIEIPNSVTSIGEGAFYYCQKLTSIEIPNSVTSIGRVAFYGSYALSVYYRGTVEDWADITFGSNISSYPIKYYYVENESDLPASGNYWHYVDGVPTVWAK